MYEKMAQWNFQGQSAIATGLCIFPEHSNIFSETACPIKANFHMYHPCERRTKVYINDTYHMTKMASMAIDNRKAKGKQ